LVGKNFLLYTTEVCHKMTVYSSMRHVSWKSGHVLHRAVNCPDVIKMSDGHRNVVIR